MIIKILIVIICYFSKFSNTFFEKLTGILLMVPMNNIINTAINMIFISVSSSFLQFFYQFLAHCPVVFCSYAISRERWQWCSLHR